MNVDRRWRPSAQNVFAVPGVREMRSLDVRLPATSLYCAGPPIFYTFVSIDGLGNACSPTDAELSADRRVMIVYTVAIHIAPGCVPTARIKAECASRPADSKTGDREIL